MEQRTLDGMAAFVRRVCAQLPASRPEQPDRAITPRFDSHLNPSPLIEADPLPELWAVEREPVPSLSLYARYDRSPEQAASQADWQLAEEALDSGAEQKATVVGWNRGGLLVHWRSLQGFLPASQLQRMIRYTTNEERDTAFASRVGEEMRLKVIEVDRSRKRLVFSERALQWDGNNGQCLWEDLEAGQVRLGRVRNLCDFGAFIDLGGIDGLIHISEIAWSHVRHPSDTLQIGQEVDVYVMSVEPERKRVALSIKKLAPDPWQDVNDRYFVGQIVDAVVTNVTNFGAFARIEDGIEGLVHISEMGEGTILHPRNVVAEGDTITVRIISIETENRRLALSIRQAAGSENTPYGPVSTSE